jgi:hypothetical protein
MHPYAMTKSMPLGNYRFLAGRLPHTTRTTEMLESFINNAKTNNPFYASLIIDGGEVGTGGVGGVGRGTRADRVQVSFFCFSYFM